MCDISALCQKGSLTPSPPALQKHINQVSQKCHRPSTCHCGLLCGDWSSDGRLPRSLTSTIPSSYPCINLHTLWKITNDNVFEKWFTISSSNSDKQFPFTKKGGSKTETDGDREGERKMCQDCFLYWHLWLRGCEKMCVRVSEGTCVSWEQKTLWIFDACWRLQWPL